MSMIMRKNILLLTAALVAAALVGACTTLGTPEATNTDESAKEMPGDPVGGGGGGALVDDSGTGYADSDVAPGEGGYGGEGGAEGEPMAPDGGEGGEGGETEPIEPEPVDPAEPDPKAGLVTAAEWNDLDNWAFWGGLMTGETYQEFGGYWGLWTNNRVAVTVVDQQEQPLAGIKVTLMRNGATIWTTVTDNLGRAECWVSLLQEEQNVDAGKLTLKVQETEQAARLTAWDCPNGVSQNRIVLETASPAEEKADIAFIVDATGSMADEIAFLKEDLMDILNTVAQLQTGVSFRTAALFYRDIGDDYITRPNDFTANPSATVSFISQQRADGGGDFPEAVHTALEETLKLSWDPNAKTHLAFLLLDAPAHHESADVLKSLQQSIPAFAAAGIKIIPISASGIDKSTEFMLRQFAAATNGTYVFITNDSGIGGEHLEASVGDYEVEYLNELIVRLIKKYTD